MSEYLLSGDSAKASLRCEESCDGRRFKKGNHDGLVVGLKECRRDVSRNVNCRSGPDDEVFDEVSE